MKLTKFALENTRVIFIILLIIILGGISAYFNLPRAEDPGFKIRTAVVSTTFPGASSDKVEMLITDKLEKRIQEIPEIDFISSESKSGFSIIYVRLKDEYFELQPIWDKLRRKVELAKSELPKNISGPFVDDEYGDVFGTIITITGEGFSYRELKTFADSARDELLRLKNVAKVDIVGTQQETIFAEYDRAKLAKLGLSGSQLAQILESRNILASGGTLKIGDERIALEPSGNYNSLEDIKKTVVNLNNEVLYLGDIVDIKRGYVDPPVNKVYSTGKDALVLAVSMKEGGNMLTLGKELKSAVANFQQSYPIGVEFDFVSFQPERVKRLTGGFVRSLIQSIAVVVALMFIFLGKRLGIFVSSIIPITILMSFMIMSNLNIGIEKMSLTALIISLGLLVDNAIVISESIMTRSQEGFSIKDAVLDSAKELKTPLLISTLTTAAAFLPIFLAESDVGEYTSSIFKVVTITLLCSWVLSLTVLPVFCMYFVKPKKQEKGVYDNKFYEKYTTALVTVLKKPYKSLAVIGLVFVIAMLAFGFVPKIFFPNSNRASFTIELISPIGTSIEKTTEITKKTEAFLTKEFLIRHPEAGGRADQREDLNKERSLLSRFAHHKKEGITSWSTYIGRGAPRFYLSYSPEQSSPHYSTILINTTDKFDIDKAIKTIERFCLDTFPDAKPIVQKLALGPPEKHPVEVRISGRDINKLYALSDSVQAKLRNIKGTKLIADDWGERAKKLVVDINQEKAHRAGVTNADIATSLQSALGGVMLSEYRENDKLIPIVYRAKSGFRDDMAKLDGISIYTKNKSSVPLSQIATIKPEWQYAKILRRDRLKTITVQSQLEKGTTGHSVIVELKKELAKENWEVGYSWEVGGVVESSAKANKSISDKQPIAAFAILLLIIVMFNSIRKTAIVLLTIPLAIIGVVIGLLVARSYFGFMTLLGVISLAGIVINNAVVLLDRIKIELEYFKENPQLAIITACKRRIRPILLTTATTVGGLIPLWMAPDPMFKPIAIAIIFGLMFSTVLTLGFVPLMYSLFYGVSFSEFEGDKETKGEIESSVVSL